jgi:hypothetical protein
MCPVLHALASRRVEIETAPPRRRVPVLPAVLLGHAPGAHVAEALPEAAVEALHAAGYEEVAEALRRRARGELLLSVPDLSHLPLAFTSLAAFREVFPEAGRRSPAAPRPLPGAGSWLSRAVEDFFQAGGELCWVVVVPEAEGAAGFLPSSSATVQGRLVEPTRLRGFEILAVLPDAGLVAAPDLERLALPPDLVAPDELEAPAPPPEFMPCGSAEAPPARPSLPPPEPPVPGVRLLLDRVTGFLAAFRPDVQWLHTLPIASRRLRDSEHGQWLPAPAAAPLALDPSARPALDELAADEHRARVLQPLWPYLRDPGGALWSPSGLLAGVIAESARRQGPWRSVAGRALPTAARPFPAVEVDEAAALREAAHISVLTTPAGPVELDDERTPSELFDHSAEAARFFGWFLRRLTRLAESLVFVADPHDRTARLAVEQELERLRHLGVLIGGLGDPAFTVTGAESGKAGEGQLILEIELRLALPIDLIRVALVGRDGRWAVEPGGRRG